MSIVAWFLFWTFSSQPFKTKRSFFCTFVNIDCPYLHCMGVKANSRRTRRTPKRSGELFININEEGVRRLRNHSFNYDYVEVLTSLKKRVEYFSNVRLHIYTPRRINRQEKRVPAIPASCLFCGLFPESRVYNCTS